MPLPTLGKHYLTRKPIKTNFQSYFWGILNQLDKSPKANRTRGCQTNLTILLSNVLISSY